MTECNHGPSYSLATLLDGRNVRLNWNIESDMNVNWIKFKNFLVCTDLRINSTEFSHILHHV
jgi:hypothetical protein